MRIQCPFSKAKIQINPQFFRLSFTWHWNLYPRYAFSPFWENFQLSWIVRAIRARVRLLSIKQATSINSRFLKYLFKVQQDNLDLEYGLFAPFSFKVVQNFIFSLFFSNFFFVLPWPIADSTWEERSHGSQPHRLFLWSQSK